MTREDRLIEAVGEIDDCADRLGTAYEALRTVLDEYAVDAAQQGGNAAAFDVTSFTERLVGEMAGRLAATQLKPIFYHSSAPKPVENMSALWIGRLTDGKLATGRTRPSEQWAPLAGQKLVGGGSTRPAA
jgi:hypothetical protein